MARALSSKPDSKTAASPRIRDLVRLHQGPDIYEATVLQVGGPDETTFTVAAFVPPAWQIFEAVRPRSSNPNTIGWSSLPPADASERVAQVGDEVVYFSARADEQDPLMECEPAVIEAIRQDGYADLQLTERSMYVAPGGRIIIDLDEGATTPGARFVPHVEREIARALRPNCFEFPEFVPSGALVDPRKRESTGRLPVRSVEAQIEIDAAREAESIAAREERERLANRLGDGGDASQGRRLISGLI